MIGCIRTILAALFACAFAAPALAQSLTNPTVTPLYRTGTDGARVNVVIMGDGYLASELGTFQADAQQLLDTLLTSEPYSGFRDMLNVYRVDVASATSGAGENQSAPRDTAFRAYFNCLNIQRLVCIDNRRAEDALIAAGFSLSTAHIRVIIVNSTQYGGSGGSFAAYTRNTSAMQVALHEIGHQFALLEDEYVEAATCTAGTYGSPSERANTTARSERSEIPWAAWIDPATPIPTTTTENDVPGLYAGGFFCDRFYRATNNSLMRSLGRAMERVNSEKFVVRFHEVSGGPLDAVSPSATQIVVDPTAVRRFVVLPKVVAGQRLPVTWRVNGVVAPADQPNGGEFTFAAAGRAPGLYTITASTQDPTAAVRIDPNARLAETRTWTLEIRAADGPSRPLLATLPSVRATPTSTQATAFATVVNPGASTLSDCRFLAATAPTGATLTWRRTNPATNAAEGEANPLFSLAPGGVGTFVFGIGGGQASANRDIGLNVACAGASPSEITGANRFVMTTQSSAAADVIAIASTLSGDGIMNLPPNAGFGVFAAAAVNIGAAADLVVRPIAMSNAGPVGMSVCETNAQGQCLSPPAPSLRTSFAANQTRTFSVFGQAFQSFPFDPAEFRTQLEFRDAASPNALRGGASVALRLQ
jgi:hypothetical protein